MSNSGRLKKMLNAAMQCTTFFNLFDQFKVFLFSLDYLQPLYLK